MYLSFKIYDVERLPSDSKRNCSGTPIQTSSSAWARRAPPPPHLTLLPTGLFGQVFGDEQACFAAAHDVEVSIAIQILYRDLHRSEEHTSELQSPCNLV